MVTWFQALLTSIPTGHLIWIVPTTAILTVLTLTFLSNVLFFPRLKGAIPREHPKVSVLIPARNEAERIRDTVTTLLQQDYEPFELLVLDDNSEDGTGQSVLDAAAGDERCRLLDGEPLPAGWLGKNWACYQLARAATGEYLVFIDADVTLADNTLSTLVAHAQTTNADMLSIWPTQIVRSIAERVLVPLINLVILSYIPALGIHFTPWSIFAAANGQCILFSREAYWGIQGHHSVRDNVLEDVNLARIVKQHGYQLRLAIGNQMVSCRMYDGWTSVRDGFAKNLLAGYGNSPVALFSAGIFHWLIFVVPWVAILFGAGWYGITLGMWGILLRIGTAALGNTPILDAFSLPFSVPIMSRIAWQSYRWAATGQNQWKGRQIS